MPCPLEFPTKAYLVYDAVPGETSVVDNNVDLSPSKLGSFLDQLVYILSVQHITWYGYRFSAGIVDSLCDCIGLGCSSTIRSAGKFLTQCRISRINDGNTSIDVLHNDLCALFGKEIRCFCADALSAACYYGDLSRAGQYQS